MALQQPYQAKLTTCTKEDWRFPQAYITVEDMCIGGINVDAALLGVELIN